MKKIYLLLIPVLSLILSGCGGGDRTEYKIDTSALEAAFANASGPVREEVDAAAADFRSEDVVGGSEHLINAIKTGNLSDDELNAIANAVAMMQNWMTNDADKWENADYQDALNSVISALPN